METLTEIEYKILYIIKDADKQITPKHFEKMVKVVEESGAKGESIIKDILFDNLFSLQDKGYILSSSQPEDGLNSHRTKIHEYLYNIRITKEGTKFLST